MESWLCQMPGYKGNFYIQGSYLLLLGLPFTLKRFVYELPFLRTKSLTYFTLGFSLDTHQAFILLLTEKAELIVNSLHKGFHLHYKRML